MIIAKAPLRISFAGGGTDLRAFYGSETGSVVSTSIDKYIYVAVHKYFYDKILLKYSKTELVDDVEKIENELFRECIKLVGIKGGIEITSVADLPSKTGLGSSGTFAVALLHALHAFKGEHVSKEQLAREAVQIEVEILKNPIGKQDQYIAAYGGLNFIEFNPDESVFVSPLVCKKDVLERLQQNLMLFYVGDFRSASEILAEQQKKTEDKRETLRKMKKISDNIKEALVAGELDRFAALLHEGWLEKRKVTDKISNPKIDGYYEKAIAAGAKGGKLLGAGGGGFLLFYCDKEKQENLKTSLKDLRNVGFNFERGGSRLIYVED